MALIKSRMNQLKELNWLDQVYNVILMGPSRTGYVKLYIIAAKAIWLVQWDTRNA